MEIGCVQETRPSFDQGASSYRVPTKTCGEIQPGEGSQGSQGEEACAAEHPQCNEAEEGNDRSAEYQGGQEAEALACWAGEAEGGEEE